jgi:predicted phosphodiesterase
MRYAVISDIHANIEALGAVLGRIEAVAVDEVVCLGDVVGYYANPNECVDTVRMRGIRCIAGNHDRVGAGMREPGRFGYAARHAIYRTRALLTETSAAFLASLPTTEMIGEEAIAVHGSLFPMPNEDEYLFSKDDVHRCFEGLEKDFPSLRICFFGHTHRRVVYERRDGTTQGIDEGTVRLWPDGKYLINPGSVGQPRGANLRAEFVVYDDHTAVVEAHCVEYDRTAVLGKAEAAGLLVRETHARKARELLSDLGEAFLEFAQKRMRRR